MKRVQWLLVSLLFVTLTSLAMGRKDAAEKGEKRREPRAEQGIAGKVELWEGNFMPMVEPGKGGNRIVPGSFRRVRVHEPVNVSGGQAATKRDSILTPLIAETTCDSLGRFFIEVDPGEYSIFVEEDGGWYFNGFDGRGIQGAVKVEPHETTSVIIKVTSKATF